MRESEAREILEKTTANPVAPRPFPFSASQLKGDLDNIILMSLRQEPSRRYASVEDFSKDISNYLNRFPIRARPNTFFYRASKFYLRNKTASIVGFLLILSLIGGIIATSWQAVVANRERNRAQKRFQDVRKLSNSLLFEITPKIEQLQGSTEAREILVKRALEYLDSLATESKNDAALQSELASAYSKIGEIQGDTRKPSLGDISGSIQSFEKANAILQTLPQTVESKKLTAENLRQLAKVRQNDVQTALSEGGKAIEIYENLYAENPETLDFYLSSIETQSELAQLHTNNSDFKAALNQLDQTIPKLEKLDQSNHKVIGLMALVRSQKAYSLSWEGRQTEAEAEMNAAVSQAENLALKYQNEVDVQHGLWEVYQLASAIFETIKDEISLEFAEKAIKVKEKAVDLDNSDTISKRSLARSHSRAGVALARLNRLSEAEKHWEEAEKLLDTLVSEFPKNPGYQADLGFLYFRVGFFEKSVKSPEETIITFQKALQHYENIVRNDEKHFNALNHIGMISSDIGDVYLKINDKGNAKDYFQKSLKILNQLKMQDKLPNSQNKNIEKLTKQISEIEAKH